MSVFNVRKWVGVRAVSALAVGLCTPGAGCSDALLRETVLANTETLIGVSVAQDPKTNLYQGRLGYSRHELFMVPTSKRIVKEGETGEGANDASSTPEVLGEIMADGVIPSMDGLTQPARVGVYQRLAVGRLAVQSGAAVALLARDAKTVAALATADAATDRDLDRLAGHSAGVALATGSGTQRVPWTEAADAWSRSMGFASYDDLYTHGTPDDRRALARRWQAALDDAAAQAARDAQKAQTDAAARAKVPSKTPGKAEPKGGGQ